MGTYVNYVIRTYIYIYTFVRADQSKSTQHTHGVRGIGRKNEISKLLSAIRS